MSEQNIPEELVGFRAQIDALDDELMELFAKRFQVVRNVGHMKAEKGMQVVQSQRAEEVIESAVQIAKQKGVPEDFIRKLYEMMIDEAHVIEHAIVDNVKGS